jgi:hypothetical protein
MLGKIEVVAAYYGGKFTIELDPITNLPTTI